MEISSYKNMVQQKSGFALLMTLVVVSVLISIGLTVLDLSIKQVRLSSNAKDSEIAFHAANAGVECAKYWRRNASSTMERGGAISPNCFSATVEEYNDEVISQTAEGDVFRYQYAFTWGPTGEYCSRITTLVASSTPLGSDLVVSNVPTYIEGYPETDLTCVSGERCTVLSVRGFNRPCDDTDGYGVVQR